MNIKFGMDNYYVRYLKRFLNHELGISNRVLGSFDKNDQTALINYLNLPNVEDMFTVVNKMNERYSNLNTLFFNTLKDNSIIWTSKSISVEASDYIKDNLDDIKEYLSTLGWEVTSVEEWIDTNYDINRNGVIDTEDARIIYNIINDLETYDEATVQRADLNLDGKVDNDDYQLINEYLTNTPIHLTISQVDRKNYFPNEDMKIFVNQFDGKFMYGYAIRDGGVGQDDQPHQNPTGQFKIAIYKCRPGQQVTIAHNSPNNEHLVIGSSTSTLYENIPNDLLKNVVEIDLKPGQGYQYTCTKAEGGVGNDAHWLCIQCPSSYSDLGNYDSFTALLQVGDINFDGKIDMQDYQILAEYTATGPGAEYLTYNKANWTPTDRQLAVMDIPIPDGSGSGIAGKDGKITREDAVELYKFITGQSTQPSLGLVEYTYKANASASDESDNVEQLLIIDGAFYNYNVNTQKYDDGFCISSNIVIPFNEFRDDPWIVHHKFFNYLLNMSVHKYSNSEDISYMQKLLGAKYPVQIYDVNGYFNVGTFDNKMRELVWRFQRSHTNFTIGDLNRDGKIDANDLMLERKVIECMNADINGDGKINQTDFNLLNDYLNGTGTLTPEQLERADINFDGVIDNRDLAIIQEYIDGTREDIIHNNTQNVSELKYRADINQDGKWNSTDYYMLQNEIEGTTDFLKNYDIPFMLGWIDVDTETLLEQEVNYNEDISEVSK